MSGTPKSHLQKAPTTHTAAILQEAFDSANKALFQDTLPACMILLHRRGRAYGYFCPHQFQRIGKDDVIGEIAISPDAMGRAPHMVLSTLVHEMTHLWQFTWGKPSRPGYHNRQWADKMDDIGLPASDTSQPGGMRTGRNVDHYIEPGGQYDLWVRNFLTDDRLFVWTSTPAIKDETTKKPKTKVAYTCGTHKVWGKPGLSFTCDDCKKEMQEQNPDDTND